MRTSLLLAFLLLGACSKAEPATKGAPSTQVSGQVSGSPEPAPTGTTYGAGVSDVPVVKIDDLLASPKTYEGKTVRVEGLVTDVCPKRGCWMDLAGSGPGQKVRFKVQDGVMTFPMEAKGSQAMAQGVVVVTTMSLEESREYAKYQAEEYGATVDPETITEPMTIVRLDGTGAVVR